MTCTCKGHNMTENIHKFKTIQAIADELDIKRQTLYNRAKKTEINISKKKFTDEEWSALVNNKKLTNVNKNINKELSQIDILNLRIEEQSSFIKTLSKEIEAKNIQIERSQQLQLIAEQRLTETNKTLIEYQEKENNTKKGFWARMFGYKQ